MVTNKKSIQSIIETAENEKNKDEVEISLFENENKPFDLLIPVYKEIHDNFRLAKFNISSTV